MRVSPALLACFSLVAISALPSRAAESSETVDSASTLEATLADAPQIAQQPAAEDTATADSIVAPAASEPVTDGPTFTQLLASVENRAAPPLLAQATPAEDETLPADTDVDIEPEPIPPAGGIETEPETAVPNILPTPATPDNANPSIEIPVDGSEIDVNPAGEIAPDSAAPDSDDADDAETEEDATPAAPTNVPVPTETVPEAAPTQADPEAEAEEAEAVRVLVSEVVVASDNDRRPLTDELIAEVYRAAQTEPGRTTTSELLQEDINSIFSTGFFSNVRALPEDTPLGVRVTFFVEPNPVLTNVTVRTGSTSSEENRVLPAETVDEIFGEQYGQVLNLRDLQDGILDLNDWYQDNGYVLAQVTAAPQISDDGTVTLIVAEGEIESIEVRFINEDGQTTDDEGNPIGGKTRDFIVTREFETQPGDVFQESQIQEDIGRAFGLGIFDDIRLSLDPGDEDPRKVKLIVNIDERETGSVGASLGFNLRGDLFGQLSYNEDNFGGNNQKLRTEGRVTTTGDFLFDVSFTDPWIAGDPYRTSYTASLFNRRATSLIFENGPIDVPLPNGDTPRLNRLGTGISFSRPLDNGLSLSLGAQYERVALLDGGGTVTPRDAAGNLLTASTSGRDDLFTVQFGAVLDQRNNPASPTSGSLFRLGSEQAIPIGSGSIFYNKLRGSYSQYVPVNFLGADDGRETIALNLQGGTALGDIPAYEAFPLGGGNSVRGYEEGAVGSGRSFLLGTVEYRFPLFSEFLNGAIFADYGTDLGSGSAVPGDPAGIRGKPGSGFGYGAGVRVQTPLGALRLDYGLSDTGSRFHFGFGERF